MAHAAYDFVIAEQQRLLSMGDVKLADRTGTFESRLHHHAF